jgi:hypothetical protein
MKTVLTLAAVAAFAAVPAYAQLSQNNGCTPGAQNCTGSNQNSGDTTSTNNYGDTHSTSSQLGNSSASNTSGNNIGFDNRTQTTQNANNTTTGTISGGNTSSGATGGAATGNLSSNDNRTSVGNTSSNSGGNTLGADSRASVGNTSAAGGAGGAGGTARQGQGQGQTASVQGGNSTSGATANTGASRSLSAASGGNQRQSATGGVASGSATANGAGQRTAVNAGSGNGQSTTIGGSSYSDNSRTLFIPPVVPATPPSVVGVGQVIQTTLACGPLQTVVKEPVIGTYFGMFSNEQIEQGHTDFLAPVLDALGHQVSYREETLPNGDIRLFGTQPVIFATVVSIAGARNVAIGGGGGSGWGQAGGGASASMSQLVTNVQLHECEVGTLHTPVVWIPPAIPDVPATPVPHAKKRIVARKAKPCIAPK